MKRGQRKARDMGRMALPWGSEIMEELRDEIRHVDEEHEEEGEDEEEEEEEASLRFRNE